MQGSRDWVHLNGLHPRLFSIGPWGTMARRCTHVRVLPFEYGAPWPLRATSPRSLAGVASRLPTPNSKGMSLQPETQVSTFALGPASLPGPGGEFAPTPATSGPRPTASSLTPATREMSPAASDPTQAASDPAPAQSDLAPAESSPVIHQPEPPPPQRIPRWLVRVELFLRVMLRMYIGLAICYAPWSHAFWDQNPIFLQFPALGMIAVNGAVRGLVSGLGLLNLWIAFQDALRRDRD
jgi:hypothetical protein